MKRKKDTEEELEKQEVSLEKRLKLLEKSSKDQVDDLKEKVRCLCLQENLIKCVFDPSYCRRFGKGSKKGIA